MATGPMVCAFPSAGQHLGKVQLCIHARSPQPQVLSLLPGEVRCSPIQQALLTQLPYLPHTAVTCTSHLLPNNYRDFGRRW